MSLREIEQYMTKFKRPFFIAELLEHILSKKLKRRGIEDAAGFIARRVGTKIPSLRAAEVGIAVHPLAVMPSLKTFKIWHSFVGNVRSLAKMKNWEVFKLRRHSGPSQFLIVPGEKFELPRQANVQNAKREVEDLLAKTAEMKGIQSVRAMFYGLDKHKKFFTPYSDVDMELHIHASDRGGISAFEKLVLDLLRLEKDIKVKVTPYRTYLFVGGKRVENAYNDAVMRLLKRKVRWIE